MRKLNDYSCKHCSKTFSTNFSLVRHQLVHTQIKPFQCAFCTKTFALAQYQREHEFIHTNLKPFVCGVNGCTESFRQRGKLSLHRRTHGGYTLKQYKLQRASRRRNSKTKRAAHCIDDEDEMESAFEECDFSTTHESEHQLAPEASPLPENPLLLLLRAHEDLEKSDSGYASYDCLSERGSAACCKVDVKGEGNVIRIALEGGC